MRLRLIGGPRDGDWVSCCLKPVCKCPSYWHASTITDSYVAFLMYRRTAAGWVPDRIVRKHLPRGAETEGTKAKGQYDE